MKKLLIMNDLVYGGGVEKVMLDIVNHLDKDKYKVTILTPNYDMDFYNYFDKNIDYLYINNDLLGNKTLISKIYNKFMRKINIWKSIININKNRFDIAIAIKEGPCMKYISKLKVPNKLAWIHTDYDVFYWTKSCFRTNEELKCMKKFTKVVCVSNQVKESVIRNVGDSRNLCVRYNPLDEKLIVNKSKEQVDDIIVPSDKLLFITVGRLTEQKGYDRLLNVCKALKNEKYNYELWIIGDGNEYENLQDFIIKNNITNVKLLGVKDNPYKYIKLADWFICSSTWESFGLAIQESIILGVPVITTNCPGACELLNTSIDSIIVKNSEVGILEGMKRVLDDLSLGKIYKEKINNKCNLFTLKQRIKKIEELL